MIKIAICAFFAGILGTLIVTTLPTESRWILGISLLIIGTLLAYIANEKVKNESIEIVGTILCMTAGVILGYSILLILK